MLSSYVNGENVAEVSMKPTFHGRPRSVMIEIENNTASETSGSVLFRDYKSPFESSYACVCIPSGSSQSVSITCSPPPYQPATGFVSVDHSDPGTCIREIFSLVTQSGLILLSLPVSCVVHVPLFHVLSDTLVFGDSPLADYRNNQTVLHNDSLLPIDWNIPITANFSFEPSSGRIPAMSQQVIVGTFSPKRLGPIFDLITVKFCSSTYTTKIHCEGYATATPATISTKSHPRRGPLATVDDFNRPRKYSLENVSRKLSKSPNRSNSLQLLGLTYANIATRKVSKTTKPASTHISREVLRESVIVDPDTVNFGRVYIGTEERRSVTISNTLSYEIQVRLQSIGEGLVEVPTNTVTIPARGIKVFRLVLDTAEVVKECQGYIQEVLFLVNGIPWRTMNLNAKILLKSVSVSPTTVDIRFDSLSLLSSAMGTVTLTNNCTCRIDVECSLPDEFRDSLSLSVGRCTIEAGEAIPAVVTYTPTPDTARIETSLRCNVIGGVSTEIPISALCPIGVCQITPLATDLGFVGGVAATRTVTVKNIGQSPSVFYCDPEKLPDCIAVKPSRGRLLPGQSTDVSITYVPSCGFSDGLSGDKADTSFTHTIEFGIRAGRSVAAIISGVLVYPEISAVLHGDFSGTILGSERSVEFELRNLGPNVHTNVSLDLTGFGEELLVRDWTLSTTHPVGSVIYTRTLPPASSCEGMLIYTPTSVRANEVKSIPVWVNGKPSACTMSTALGCVGALIEFTPSNSVDFGEVMVGSSKELMVNLQLTQPMSAAVEWSLGSLDGTFGITVIPSSGKLILGKPPTRIIVRFEPKSVIVGFGKVPLVVNVNDNPHIILNISGAGVRPCLAIEDDRMVVFTPVALNQRAERELTILNKGYSRPTSVMARFDVDNIPITVSFPDGNVVDMNSRSVRIVLTFESSQPTSVTLPLHITTGCDHEGIVSVQVSAVCDSSVLTRLAGTKSASIQAYFGVTSVLDMNTIVTLLERLAGAGKYATYCGKHKLEPTSPDALIRFLISQGALVGQYITSEALAVTGSAAFEEILFQMIRVFIYPKLRFESVGADADTFHHAEVGILMWLSEQHSLATTGSRVLHTGSIESNLPACEQILSSHSVESLLSVIINLCPYIQALAPYRPVEWKGLLFSGNNRNVQIQVLLECLSELGFARFSLSHSGQLYTISGRDTIVLGLFLYQRLRQVSPVDVRFDSVLGKSCGKRINIGSLGRTGKRSSRLESQYLLPLYGDDAASFTVNASQLDFDGQLEITYVAKFSASSDCILHVILTDNTPLILKLHASVPRIEPIWIRNTAVLQLGIATSIDISIPSIPYTGNFNITVRDSTHPDALQESVPVRILTAFIPLMTSDRPVTISLTFTGLELILKPRRLLLWFRDLHAGEFVCGTDVIVGDPPIPTTPALVLASKAAQSIHGTLQLPSFHHLEAKDYASLDFNVSLSSTRYFSTTTKTVTVPTHPTATSEAITIPIDFSPKDPGEYFTVVTLRSTTRGQVLHFLVKGLTGKPPEIIELRFETYARTPIKQTVWMENDTEEPVLYNITLDRHDTMDTWFTCDTGDVTVPPKAEVPLIFHFDPVWIVESDCIVRVENKETSECTEYRIELISHEPLAETHFRIPCVARDSAEFAIQVPNYSGTSVEYVVETDLLDIFGPETLSLRSNQTGVYVLHVKPACARQVTGSITFTDPSTGRFVWFTAELKSAPPANSDTIKLQCMVGEKVSATMELVNPSEESADFVAIFDGSCIDGITEFSIPPHGSFKYGILFAPTSAYTESGSVAFSSAQLGDIWYLLDLVGSKLPPVDLGSFECIIGASVNVNVKIHNRHARAMALTASSDNPDFGSTSPNVQVEPLMSVNALVAFTPSTVNHEIACNLTYTDSTSGVSWDFVVRGIGRAPSLEPMEEIDITSELNRSAVSDKIKFRNPFAHTAEFRISLAEQVGSSFLLRPPHTVHLKSKEVLNLQVVFHPTSMAHSETLVSVTGEGMVWRYKIVGRVELPIDKSNPWTITGEARIPQIVSNEFVLRGIDAVFDDLTVSVEAGPRWARLVGEGFKCSVVKDSWELTGSGLRIVVTARVDILRAVEIPVVVCVSGYSGGSTSRWRFQAKLEIAPPPPDDTIQIETPINTAGSVSFTLPNTLNEYSNFDAAIENLPGHHSSAPLFAISPTKGLLPPSNSGDSTRFILTFKPTEYGRSTCFAKLWIRTETSEWNFILKGTLPVYSPPVGVKSRHRLRPITPHSPST